MSETIKIEIEIPAPPEGWGEVEYRKPRRGEMYYAGVKWMNCRFSAKMSYPVARKLSPLWTPPPQWHAMFGDCWLVVDSDREVKLIRTKPTCVDGMWYGNTFWLRCMWEMIVPKMLPPGNIPWHKCCFKIGNPKE